MYHGGCRREWPIFIIHGSISWLSTVQNLRWLLNIVEAGAPLRDAKTLFDSIHDDQILRGHEILGPFESAEEWGLTKWLIKNVGHNQAEEFLKLPIVSYECRYVSHT